MADSKEQECVTYELFSNHNWSEIVSKIDWLNSQFLDNLIF
jgi:hypothetical protein